MRVEFEGAFSRSYGARCTTGRCAVEPQDPRPGGRAITPRPWLYLAIGGHTTFGSMGVNVVMYNESKIGVGAGDGC